MKLDIRDLAFGYGARTVGSGVTLTVGDGEVLALLGPNGAQDDAFQDHARPPAAEGGRCAARQPLAFRPQPHRAGSEDRVCAAGARRAFSLQCPRCGADGPCRTAGGVFRTCQKDREIAAFALERLGMAHLASRPYTEISGGERQMALIARALAQEPKILVMDEPTASLDYGNQMRVLSHIRRLASEGISVILSTHNPDHVFMVADRVALLHDGRLLALGEPKDVLTPERLKQLYDIDVVIGSLPGSASLVCSPRLDHTRL